jgi:hypothetical protein
MAAIRLQGFHRTVSRDDDIALAVRRPRAGIGIGAAVPAESSRLLQRYHHFDDMTAKGMVINRRWRENEGHHQAMTLSRMALSGQACAKDIAGKCETQLIKDPGSASVTAARLCTDAFSTQTSPFLLTTMTRRFVRSKRGCSCVTRHTCGSSTVSSRSSSAFPTPSMSWSASTVVPAAWPGRTGIRCGFAVERVFSTLFVEGFKKLQSPQGQSPLRPEYRWLRVAE